MDAGRLRAGGGARGRLGAGRRHAARARVRLRIGRFAIHGRRVQVRFSHARAAQGRTTVALRRRGDRRWRTLKRSSRRAFTVRLRARPGRYVVRARFAGSAGGRHASATLRRTLRMPPLRA